jgi:hypothetical protein
MGKPQHSKARKREEILSMAAKEDLQQYVVELRDGEVYKENGKVVVILASSEVAAGTIANRKHGFGGGDWTIRLAGDEPRIEAIELYSHLAFRIGKLSQQIADLESRRDELVEQARVYKDAAYALPEDKNAGF